MKHPTSRALHAYWDALRGARAAPERGEIAPGEIRHVLADSFILELDVPNRDARFRLAGTRVCAMFGRELRGHAFARLWAAASGSGDANGGSLVDLVLSETLGVVVGLTGRNADGEAVDLEMVLLPLRHRGRTHERMLGALSAFAPPLWLGPHPLVRLETTSLRVLGPGAAQAGTAQAGAAGSTAGSAAGARSGERSGREFGADLGRDLGHDFALIPPGAARRRTFVVLPGGAAGASVGGTG